MCEDLPAVRLVSFSMCAGRVALWPLVVLFYFFRAFVVGALGAFACGFGTRRLRGPLSFVTPGAFACGFGTRRLRGPLSGFGTRRLRGPLSLVTPGAFACGFGTRRLRGPLRFVTLMLFIISWDLHHRAQLLRVRINLFRKFHFLSIVDELLAPHIIKLRLLIGDAFRELLFLESFLPFDGCILLPLFGESYFFNGAVNAYLRMSFFELCVSD